MFCRLAVGICSRVVLASLSQIMFSLAGVEIDWLMGCLELCGGCKSWWPLMWLYIISMLCLCHRLVSNS